MELRGKKYGGTSFEYLRETCLYQWLIECGVPDKEVLSHNLLFFDPGPFLETMVPETN
jgi:hypothetical protein